MKKVIKRSLKFSLKEANKSKKGFLDKLWEDYKKVLEYFIDVGWNEKRLPKYEDVKNMDLNTGLSRRYISCALVQAQAILKSCFKRLRKRKEVSKPSIKKISMRLDERFVRIEKSNNSFDYWLAVRNPYEQEWVYFPVKNYEYAKTYQDWKLSKSVELLKQDGEWYVKFIFEKEVDLEDKPQKGIDIGYRKLITTSDGEVIGAEMKRIIERIDRKEQGSKNWRQLKHYLKTEINRWLKQFIDGSFSPVIEALKNLKKNKKGIWSRDVNRKFNYWLYGYVLRRIKELCEVAGVQYHIVPAYNTSRTCPQCGVVDRLNRCGEIFKCISCGFTADADYVGAVNVLRRFLSTAVPEELIVPLPAKDNFIGRINKCL
jgi:IS605 OrfB family transposase